MKYILSILSFTLTVLGILSQRSNDSFWGWIIIGVGFVVMIFTLYMNYKEVKLEKWQGLQKKEIKKIAYSEIHDALGNLMFPWVLAYENISYSHNCEIDFYYKKEYKVLLSSIFKDNCKDLFFKDYPKYPDLYPPQSWGNLLEHNANSFSSRIDNICAKYSMYIDANILIEINSMRKLIFYHWICDLHTLISANSHSQLNFEFLVNGFSKGEDFTDFINHVELLNSMLINEK